jgi:hypothetical protein
MNGPDNTYDAEFILSDTLVTSLMQQNVVSKQQATSMVLQQVLSDRKRDGYYFSKEELQYVLKLAVMSGIQAVAEKEMMKYISGKLE